MSDLCTSSGELSMSESEQRDLHDLESQMHENSKKPLSIKQLLEIGCGRRVGDTGIETVYCQTTRLCSRCDAVLKDISKGELAAIIQVQHDQIQKQRGIIAHRANKPHPRYLAAYKRTRRSS